MRESISLFRFFYNKHSGIVVNQWRNQLSKEPQDNVICFVYDVKSLTFYLQ